MLNLTLLAFSDGPTVAALARPPGSALPEHIMGPVRCRGGDRSPSRVASGGPEAGRAAPISSMNVSALAGLHTPRTRTGSSVGLAKVWRTPRGAKMRVPAGAGFGVSPCAGHRERPGQDIDRLIEAVMDVGRGSGEPRRHGELTQRKTRALAEHAQDVPIVGN